MGRLGGTDEVTGGFEWGRFEGRSGTKFVLVEGKWRWIMRRVGK